MQKVVPERQGDYLRCEEIAGEIQEIDEKMAHVDLLWLEQQNRKIDALTGEINALSREKEDKIALRGRLDERIRQLLDEILPGQYRERDEMQAFIEQEYTESYREQTGLPRYRQELERLRCAENVLRTFSENREQVEKDTENARNRLFAARREYAERYGPCSFRVEAADNEEYEKERRVLEESELPSYRLKIKAARESAMEQFQNDFLSRLKSSIEQVQTQVKNLNRALRQAQFGTDSYQFRVDRNPDYADYYDMIMAPELMEGDITLFSDLFQKKYGTLIDRLFSQITMADDTQLNARRQSELQENIERYTDFRTYLKFDLETTDQNGSKQLLSQTLNTKSAARPRRRSISRCSRPSRSSTASATPRASATPCVWSCSMRRSTRWTASASWKASVCCVRWGFRPLSARRRTRSQTSCRSPTAPCSSISRSIRCISCGSEGKSKHE